MRDDNSLPSAEKLNLISPPKSPRRLKTVSQFGTDLSDTFTSYKKKGHPHPALIKGVIGSTEHTKAGEACPCCRRYVPTKNRVSNVPGIIGSNSFDAAEQQQQQQVQSNKFDDMKIKQVVVKGWLHKKGSGQDILGTTSWKPRWAELVLAQKNGYNVDVPILMIYWHPTLPMPSTSITLDSHIVMPIDEGTSEWDKYRFDIVPAKNNGNISDEVKAASTRSFTAPLSQRNQWVYVLNFVLFEYEKRKAKDRSTRVLRESRRARLPQLPPSPRRVARSASPTTRHNKLPFHANEARTNLDFNPVAIENCPSLP